MLFSPAELIMRISLGVFVVLIVGAVGDDDVKLEVTGFSGGSVLLPCNCSERDLDREVKWQTEEPSIALVLIYNVTGPHFRDPYKDRAKIFLHENSNNCSIFLTNIKDKDQGTYRCKFFHQGAYKKSFVHLTIPDKHDQTTDSRYRYLKIIPVMMVLAFFLILWRRGNSHRNHR